MPAAAMGLLTAEEFARLPDDNFTYELIEGRLVRMTKPAPVHGVCAARLCAALLTYVDARGLGMVMAQDTGFKLASGPDTVRAPDVAFVAAHRIPAEGLADQGFLEGAPDLVVEVMSPSDRNRRLLSKVDHWLATGAQSVWVVRPRRRSVTVHRAGDVPREVVEPAVLTDEAMLPEFSYPLSRLFAGLALPLLSSGANRLGRRHHREQDVAR